MAKEKKRKSDVEGSTEYMKRKIDIEEHDDICDRRLSWMKTAIYLLVVFIVGGGLYGYGQTEGSRSSIAEVRAEARHNTAEIVEVKAEQQMIKKDHKELVKTVGTIDRNLAKLMGALGVEPVKTNE